MTNETKETREIKIESLRFGLKHSFEFPKDPILVWGSRAIVETSFPREGCNLLEFLPDRGDCIKSDCITKEEELSFFEELQSYAKSIKYVNRVSSEVFSHDNPKTGFHVRWSANSSYGYVYITSWLTRVELAKEL